MKLHFAKVTAALGLLAGLCTCLADNVITLGWSPVDGVSGYKLYYGLDSNSVTSFVDVGTNTTMVFSFPPAYQLFFAASSYDPTEESDLSPLVTAAMVVLPPKIAHQPADVTNALGTIATFSVQVSNSTPLYYQWKFSGTNLFATNATYSFLVTNRSLSGLYSVTISNKIGTVISAKAKLTIK